MSKERGATILTLNYLSAFEFECEYNDFKNRHKRTPNLNEFKHLVLEYIGLGSILSTGLGSALMNFAIGQIDINELQREYEK